MKRFFIVSGMFAFIHFSVSWICFTKSAVIRPSPSTDMWRNATEILAFPLVWIQSFDLGFDMFPVLMVLNSLLWGCLIGTVTLLAWRRKSRGN